MPDDTPRMPPAKSAPNAKMIVRIIGKKDALEQLESPFIRKKFVLRTPLVKRLYLRLFDPCQLCFHVITVTGRSNLASDKVGQIETTIATGLEKLMEYLQEEKRGAEALLQMNALDLDEIEVMAPLPVEARIISPLSFSLQQAISTADELVMAIELLVISGIVKINRGEQQKAEVRNRLRRTASGARLLANGVRKLIQQEQQRRAAEEATRGRSGRRRRPGGWFTKRAGGGRRRNGSDVGGRSKTQAGQEGASPRRTCAGGHVKNESDETLLRVTTRIGSAELKALQLAAQIQGTTVSEFVRRAAIDRARGVVRIGDERRVERALADHAQAN